MSKGGSGSESMGLCMAAGQGSPLLPRVLRAMATLGPVGRVPAAPGTAGSLVALGAWLALRASGGWGTWAILGALGLLAVAAGGEAARALGMADPPEVVIDEAVGMAVALALVPGGLWAALAAFAAFRVLDVAKPFPIQWFERLPGGWGIVADDVAAALYAGLAVRLAWALAGIA